jgi:hypothetical protein
VANSIARMNMVGNQGNVREIIIEELILVRENMETSIHADIFLRNKENIFPGSIHLPHHVQIGNFHIPEKSP